LTEAQINILAAIYGKKAKSLHFDGNLLRSLKALDKKGLIKFDLKRDVIKTTKKGERLWKKIKAEDPSVVKRIPFRLLYGGDIVFRR